MESFMRSCQSILSGFGVTAAGIAPQATAVIFAESPLLKQHFALVIEDKYTESAMQEPFLMNLQLLHGTYGFVVGVYKYYLWHALII